jgi:hypothetical protein
MNSYLVKKFGGDLGERVKTPMRFTDSKKFATQMQCSTRRSLDMCQAQSGITHSHQSPPNFCLKTPVSELVKTSTAAVVCRKSLNKWGSPSGND